MSQPTRTVRYETDLEGHTPCIRCGEPVEGYTPKFCCSGFDCACGGHPIDPPVCDACGVAVGLW